MARKLKEYPQIIINPDQIEGKLDLSGLFGNDRPVQIEIGAGKGTWVLAEAMSNPEVNYVSVEWARKYYRMAVDRLGRWNVKNVKMLRTDAAQLIAEHLADESVDMFHVYFPDPWPKKRHHKRRFFCQENLNQMLRALKHGGVIQVATDHEDYYRWMREVVENNRDSFMEVEFQKAAGAEEGELVGSNFERKYIKEGRTFNHFALKKV